MNLIQLLPIGDVSSRILDNLGVVLSIEFPAHCEVLRRGLDPGPTFDHERQQYSSTLILSRMQSCVVPSAWRLLGITAVDLYVPLLTFVFGEAQLNGACAVVSTYRLREEFYGLPANAELLRQRLLKEALHELGHTLGLTHCEDYRCAMAPSHAVEWIDVKDSSLCVDCRARALAASRTADRRS